MFDYQSRLDYTASYIVPGGNRSIEWILKSGYYPEGSVKINNLRIEEVSTWEGLSPDASVTPLTAEGFMNVNGNAVVSGSSSVMMLSLNPKEESNLSFDYTTGSSEISVLVNEEEEIEKISAGESGSYHYDMPQGNPVFLTIKVNTPSDKLTDGASIGNIRFTSGKYNDTPAKYNALLHSYFTEDGSYTPTDGVTYTYPLDITLTTGGKAIFKYLLPSNSIYPDQQVIVGEIVDNKIHIPTYKNVNLGTLVGYDDKSLENYPLYYNNRFWLVAGKIDKEKRQTEVLDELTFTISEDGHTITPDSDFGVYYTWSVENRDIVSFFSADSQFILSSDLQEITTTTKEIDFDTTIANGYEYKRSFTLLSAGKACEYSAVVAGSEHFSIIPEAGTLEAGESVELTVSFTSEEIGEFNGVITIYSDGNDIEIPVSANVTAVPDYSVIVTEGKDLISFDAKTEYPWAIEDGIAVSTNAGIHNSMSILTAVFTVPEGKVGMFGVEGGTCAEPSYDGFAIVVDGSTFYSDAAHNEHISFIYPFTPGDYRVEFIHVRDGVDELWTPYDQSRITSLSLNIEEPGVAHVRETAPFSMEAAVGEVASDVVSIRNTSNSSVEILSVSGAGPFGAIMPQTTVLPRKNYTVEVPITFLSDEAGEFEGIITVETTAGFVEIPVSATADYVKYIGAAETTGYGVPYGAESLAYGDIGLTTTMLYPAEAMKSLQKANIESVTFFTSNIPDYTFSCPDVLVEAGEIEANTITGPVAGLTPVMNGEMVDAYNWELTIPFDNPFTYEEGNFILQLTNNALENYAGNTPVKMEFVLASSINGSTVVSYKGYTEQTLKTVPFIKVRYTPGTLGIDKMTRPLSEIKEVRYYSIDGTPLQAPVKGLNVIITVYEDGTTSSSVMMKRQ